MAFDVVYNAAMTKVAKPLGAWGLNRETGDAYRTLPEAEKGTSYIPKGEQRLSNIGNYIKTKAYDTVSDFMHGAARRVLLGDTYDIAKDLWYEKHDQSPVDAVYNKITNKVKAPIKKGLDYANSKGWVSKQYYDAAKQIGSGGAKPTKRVDTLRDALLTKKYVNPDTVGEANFKPGTLAQRMAYEDAQRKGDKNWIPKPTFKDLSIVHLPEQPRLHRMALELADSSIFAKQRYQGVGREKLAQMIQEDYFRPALAQAMGIPEDQVNEYVKPTDQQWQTWQNLIAGWLQGYDLRDPKKLVEAGTEEARDAMLKHRYNQVRNSFNVNI